MIDWSKLLIRTSEVNSGRLLGYWDWLLEDPYHPLVLSKFGDWFLMDSEGGVHWLDLLEGDLVEVAPTVEAFRKLMTQPDQLDEWFLPAWCEALHAAGQVAGPGQCYGFEIAPRLGGPVALTNVAVTDLGAYQFWMSQVHQMPAGCPVEAVLVNAAAV